MDDTSLLDAYLEPQRPVWGGLPPPAPVPEIARNTRLVGMGTNISAPSSASRPWSVTRARAVRALQLNRLTSIFLQHPGDDRNEGSISSCAERRYGNGAAPPNAPASASAGRLRQRRHAKARSAAIESG
jgi:hypothetical protein